MDVDYGEDLVVRYNRSEFSQIRPAWCITVHKFQGSQCPNVIFVTTRDHYIMMNRELVYTGITRAQKKVVLVGNMGMLSVATGKSISKKRFTSLSNMIRQGMTGIKILLYYHCPLEEDGFVCNFHAGKLTKVVV
jgi:exodeoxyribonuclease V alpha subunit